MSRRSLRRLVEVLAVVFLFLALAACAFIAGMRPGREATAFAQLTVTCCGLLSAACAVWSVEL